MPNHGITAQTDQRPLDASAYDDSRTALTGAAQTVTLTGGPYRNVTAHLDPGSSPVHIRLDASPASASNERYADSDVFREEFASPGISALYIYDAGGVGTLNVRAW